MKRLFQILWSHAPRLLLLTCVFSLVAGLCNTFLLNIINRVIQNPATAKDHLLAFILLVILLPLLMLVNQFMMVQLTQSLTYHLRMEMVIGVLQAPLRRLEAMGENRLLAGLTADVSAISQALSLFPILFMQTTIIISCMFYLGYLYLPAALGVMVSMILGLGAYRLVQVRGMIYFNKARDLQDSLFGNFRALIQGAKELKLHKERSQSFLKDHVHVTTMGLFQTMRNAAVYFSLAGSMGRLFFFGVIGVCLFFLPNWDPDIRTEVISGYALVMLFLLGPLEQVTAVVPMVGKAFIALRRVDQLGSQLTKETNENEREQSFQGWQTIQYKEIKHGYHLELEDSTFTLGPVNLTITPGELIFLVGGNGSGKTTLAKLLLGLYMPESGTIHVDNTPVTDLNRTAFRQLFSAIFVDFFLFDEFVGLGVADSHVDEYLRLLLLHHKVKVKDGRLSTTNLSQGQRKRLALLTAYLEDRQIYLFDEWAADQDPSYKKVFYEKLLPQLQAQGKTVIVISHDDSYFHVADRIVKLDFGQLISDSKLENPQNER